MPSVAGTDSPRMARSDLYKAVASFAKPRPRTAIEQVLETFLPYFALWDEARQQLVSFRALTRAMGEAAAGD